ncbi:hypothetical protein BZ164_28865 [Pseudomonas veronii]|nr:hypothetical protein BZ164_28865 [Pseudomonas veronii]
MLGVSGGVASDMRTLLASHAEGAAQAIELFVRRAVKEIGALAALLGGLDALVFTGGIGEHAPTVRDGILDGCAWLGVTRNQHPPTGACLTTPDSPVSAWVIATDENAVIARHSWPCCRRRHRARRFSHYRLEVSTCMHSCHANCQSSCAH